MLYLAPTVFVQEFPSFTMESCHHRRVPITVCVSEWTVLRSVPASALRHRASLQFHSTDLMVCIVVSLQQCSTPTIFLEK